HGHREGDTGVISAHVADDNRPVLIVDDSMAETAEHGTQRVHIDESIGEYISANLDSGLSGGALSFTPELIPGETILDPHDGIHIKGLKAAAGADKAFVEISPDDTPVVNGSGLKYTPNLDASAQAPFGGLFEAQGAQIETNTTGATQAAHVSRFESADGIALPVQPGLKELLREFGITHARAEQSETDSANSDRGILSRVVIENAESVVRPLFLQPNIRRALMAGAQSKDGAIETDPKAEDVPFRDRAVSVTAGATGDLQAPTTPGQSANSVLEPEGIVARVFSGAAGAGLQAGFAEEEIVQWRAELNDASRIKENSQVQRVENAGPVRGTLIVPNRFGQLLRSGVKSITLQISPKHLGTARLSVSVINDHVSGTLVVESAAARAAAELSLERLAERLNQEGLQLERLDVEVAQDNDRADPRSAGNGDPARRRVPSGFSNADDRAAAPKPTGGERRERSIISATRIDALV
ncbi:MAG: flagellar hook-length control protein FliK, partial [Candidatus Zixiibacteriota bacterium]